MFAQQIWPLLPHGVHVPLRHSRPVPQLPLFRSRQVPVLHSWQSPEHPLLQHLPSTQLPLWHCPPALQFPPLACKRQEPLTQLRLPLQLFPQQGWLLPPHGTHAPPTRTVPSGQLPAHAFPLQA